MGLSTVWGSSVLARRSIQSAAWSMAAYGGAQALRFASSMILTRLLAPEYFGLMALVNVMLIGVNMFSDIGIGPNIVQSARGADRTFLDTAWTLQVIRGGVVWLLCALGAWPFALFYHDPRLTALVAASGAAALISGLNSTKILTAYRDMDMGRVTFLELGSQALTVLFTVAYASVFPSVWALVFASMFGAMVKTVISHWYLPGPNNRFTLDASSIEELIRFGRWIFVGTIISFTANSAASLILGKLLPVAEVGIFSLAVTLANIVGQAYEQVSSKVLFPVYARIRHLPSQELRARILKIRIAVSVTFIPPLCIMTVFGQNIINLLLDPRYHSGGWILQVFSAFTIPSVISATSPFYLAVGNSFLSMQLSAAKLAFYLGCAWAGWFIAGPKGIIVGMAGHSLLTYLLDQAVQRHYKIWMPRVDLVTWVLTLGAIYLGLKATGQIA